MKRERTKKIWTGIILIMTCLMMLFSCEPGEDEGEGKVPPANPYDLAFINSEKAYLSRYETAELWVICLSGNPEIR